MYRIHAERHYYAGTLNRRQDGWLLGPQLEPLEYETREAAESAIEQIENGRYYLEHGEYSRPSLTVVEHESRLDAGLSVDRYGN